MTKNELIELRQTAIDLEAAYDLIAKRPKEGKTAAEIVEHDLTADKALRTWAAAKVTYTNALRDFEEF